MDAGFRHICTFLVQQPTLYQSSASYLKLAAIPPFTLAAGGDKLSERLAMVQSIPETKVPLDSLQSWKSEGGARFGLYADVLWSFSHVLVDHLSVSLMSIFCQRRLITSHQYLLINFINGLDVHLSPLHFMTL